MDTAFWRRRLRKDKDLETAACLSPKTVEEEARQSGAEGEEEPRTRDDRERSCNESKGKGESATCFMSLGAELGHVRHLKHSKLGAS